MRAPTALPRRVLSVWAHPDDEAYLSAGLMGRVTDAGRHVTVVTATCGEKGTSDPRDFDQRHFARLRERELRAALAEVGVADLRLLDYPDGELDLVRADRAIGVIAAVMDDVRPDVVVTFGPDGITGHPDHQAVSRWVTEAWRRTGGSELLYATMTEAFVAQNAELHGELDLFALRGADGPFTVPDARLAAAYDLSDDELDRKRRVLGHHASQSEGLARLMGEERYRGWWSTEWFRRPTALEVESCAVSFRPSPAPREEAVA